MNAPIAGDGAAIGCPLPGAAPQGEPVAARSRSRSSRGPGKRPRSSRSVSSLETTAIMTMSHLSAVNRSKSTGDSRDDSDDDDDEPPPRSSTGARSCTEPCSPTKISMDVDTASVAGISANSLRRNHWCEVVRQGHQGRFGGDAPSWKITPVDATPPHLPDIDAVFEGDYPMRSTTERRERPHGRGACPTGKSHRRCFRRRRTFT